MQAGADLRKYRKALKLSQRQFAGKIGISQATLSLIESGKIALSEGVQGRVEAEFNKKAYNPTYEAYWKRVQKGRFGAQALVGNPDANFATLPVWQWEDGFDLGAAPETVEGRGLVTLRASFAETIAFEMPRGSRVWVAGEVLVFARSTLDSCSSGDLCLVQIRSGRSRAPTTMIVSIRYGEATRHRTVQFEPADASEPTFTPDPDQIEGLLRCIYRARYL